MAVSGAAVVRLAGAFSLLAAANRRINALNGRLQAGMQTKIRHILAVLMVAVMAALGCSSSGVRAAAATATDLRVGVHTDRTRLVVDLSSKVDVNVFSVADPNRLIVDLPEVEWRFPPDASQKGGIIDAVRYGLVQPGVSRLVLDLKQPARVANSYVMPPSEGKAYRLVLDLMPTDQASFRAAAQAQPAAPQQQAALSSPPAAPAAAGKSAGVKPPASPTRKPDKNRRRVIVIDPGHGGADPGALAPSGVYEKDITLAAAKDFKRRLEATKRYEVHLTRDSDVFIRLRDRIAIARAKNADLFISLHADTLASKGVRGLSVYTLSEKASDKEAADLADKENKADLIAGIDLTSENPNVTNILIDLAQRETMNESARFAGHLVGELRHVSQVLPQAHRFAGFAVLKAPDVPSVLLEMGFLSNPLDERALTDPAYRAKMADSLVQAVARFFSSNQRADRG